MGTSTFIGASQFGHRAVLYHEYFYLNPSNIFKIVKKAYELGIKGIQLLPFEPVVKAVKEVLAEGMDLSIIGTVRLHHIEEDIKLLENLNATAMITHAEITDSFNQKILEKALRKMKETGRLAGLATHKPLRILSWLRESNLDYDAIMLPLNILGVFMGSKPEEVVKILKKMDKIVIAKKVFGAGTITPREALEYIANLDCVNSVALGVASEKEATETFVLAKKIFTGKL